MTRERNAYIFHFVLVGVFLGLLTMSDSVRTDSVLAVAAALVSSLYTWFTGLRSGFQNLSCVTMILGLCLWTWYRTGPDGERAPWWGSLLFMLPGLVLYFLGEVGALKRADRRRT
jgi:hypothetical protein